MNELPQARGLDEAYRDHQARAAPHLGVEAVERELFNEATDTVEIALYVNGRMIHTKTDGATVRQILALLTGLGG